ncbi:MAG: heparinase II/III family protein [Planctomycetota bacterium]|jgi:hypothetical protein
MVKNAFVFWLFFFVLGVTVSANEFGCIKPDRVEVIAGMLSEKPIGLGCAITDRTVWDELAKSKGAKETIAKAEGWLAMPIYGMSDEIYLDFLKTGSREVWYEYDRQSRRRLIELVHAECIENKGRFLCAIERAIEVICSAKTWVMPFHDIELKNFHGKSKRIDLNVADICAELAICDHLLSDRLNPQIRELIRTEIENRAFIPFRDNVAGKTPELKWFLEMRNNWAAVCYAGILAASQILIEPRDERAFYIAAIEHYIQNYIDEFADDGYCWEGVGYWVYGFSNFIKLSETVYKATDGKLDMLRDEKILRIARFGARMEILPGVYSIFADCRYNYEVPVRIMDFTSKKYGLGLKQWEQKELELDDYSLFATAIYAFCNSASQAKETRSNQFKTGVREWFEDAASLICRPSELKKNSVAIAIKGGNNGESHNHDDVGSFEVAKGKGKLLVDPGSVIYKLSTFGSNRYKSKIMNSYGHSVPLVAGKLQRQGKDAKAEVLKREFTEEKDVLIFDISSAYDVNGLEKLERTFIYSRIGAGTLTVIDEVSFSEPQSFGMALITYGKVRWMGNGNLVVSDGKESVKVNITVTGGEFEIVLDRIMEDMNNGGMGRPKRIGINLKGLVKKARIETVVTSM